MRFGSILRRMTPPFTTPDVNKLATREQIDQKPKPSRDSMGKGCGGTAASHPMNMAAAKVPIVTSTRIALCVGDNFFSCSSATSLRYFSEGEAFCKLRRRSLNFCCASFIFYPLYLRPVSYTHLTLP